MKTASLDLRHLRYFVAVAEELHFGRAAERLGISQPPLSEQIRTLEASLGVALLQRTRRHVALTGPGRVLYDEATRLIAHAERVASVMRGARTGHAGQLFLGCVPSGLFGVLPRILEGRDASFDIRVTEAHTAEIVAAVADGRLDCGLVWEDRAPRGLALRALERVRFIVAVPARHPLARRAAPSANCAPTGGSERSERGGRSPLAAKRRVGLRELAREQLIVPPRDVTPHQFDRIHAGFRDAGVTPRIGQHARSIAAQLGFVASGLGYALVPAYATRLAMPNVVFLALREALDSVPLSLVWDEARASAQLAAFRAQVERAFPRKRGASLQ